MASSPLSLSRRTLVAAAAAAAAFPTRLLAQQSRRVLAGTYVQEGGAGLVPLEPSNGAWTARRALPEIANASFGVRSAALGLRYLVDEQAQGGLGIYGRDFRRLARVSTLAPIPAMWR